MQLGEDTQKEAGPSPSEDPGRLQGGGDLEERIGADTRRGMGGTMLSEVEVEEQRRRRGK